MIAVQTPFRSARVREICATLRVFDLRSVPLFQGENKAGYGQGRGRVDATDQVPYRNRPRPGGAVGHGCTGNVGATRERQLTGRERIETAFSDQGARILPAVICYESVFLRDHWAQLTRHPWWYLHVSDTERQVAWTRDLVAAVFP